MTTKLVTTDLKKEIVSVMSMLNGRQGIVDHDLSGIERELSNRGVSYNNYELETAIVELIREERIVIHICLRETNSSKYNVSLRTLC